MTSSAHGCGLEALGALLSILEEQIVGGMFYQQRARGARRRQGAPQESGGRTVPGRGAEVGHPYRPLAPPSAQHLHRILEHLSFPPGSRDHRHLQLRKPTAQPSQGDPFRSSRAAVGAQRSPLLAESLRRQKRAKSSGAGLEQQTGARALWTRLRPAQLRVLCSGTGTTGWAGPLPETLIQGWVGAGFTTV